MIPETIHHVWVGSKLPDMQRRHIDTWRRTNPDFDLVLWNEDNIDFSLPLLRAAYERRLWAKVADIVWLKIPEEHGGFYLDVDFVLYRSLKPPAPSFPRIELPGRGRFSRLGGERDDGRRTRPLVHPPCARAVAGHAADAVRAR